jgi:electron transfer flavoprotein alpha subunit
VGDAIGLSLDAQGHFLMLKPAFSGAIVAPILSRTMPQLVTVRPGVLAERAADSSRRPRIERWTPTGLPQSRTRLLHHETTLDELAARLQSARVVVGVGMGIGDPRHIPTLHTLAEAFQGALCATRRVTDKGWMPRQLQVGLTGKVIAPQVYLAIGMRRALSRHWHPASRNHFGHQPGPQSTDLKYARYGAVADWSQIVPAMLNELGH